MKPNQIKLHDGTIVTLSEESIKELKGAVRPNRWVPDNGERFWCVDDFGYTTSYLWEGSNTGDQFKLSQENVFKTEEEAEKYLEYLNAEAVLKESAEWWTPNWEDSEELKYYVFFSRFGERLVSGSSTDWQRVDICFETEEKARSSIKNHKKEWEIYFKVN